MLHHKMPNVQPDGNVWKDLEEHILDLTAVIYHCHLRVCNATCIAVVLQSHKGILKFGMAKHAVELLEKKVRDG